MPKQITSIGCLKMTGIGDMILLSAIISQLRDQFPKARVYLFTGKVNFVIGTWIDGVEVEVIDALKPLSSTKLIRSKNLDFLIDFDSWPKINALITCFSKAKYTIGFSTPNQHRHYLYDNSVSHIKKQHEIDNYRDLVTNLGVRGYQLPYFTVPFVGRKNRVVLHLFSAGSKAHLKEWPEVYWYKLISLLRAKGYMVTISGSSGDRKRIDQFFVKYRIRGVTNSAGDYCLQKLAHYLKESLLLISIDTGIAHLSAAIDVPTVVLHGPTLPEHWGALGKNVHYIRGKVEGGCIRLGFDTKCKTNACMKSISVKQVYTEAMQFLSNVKTKEYAKL